MPDVKVKPTEPETQAILPPQRTESRQSIQDPVPVTSAVQREIPPEEIASLAYQLWIERGSPHGSHEEDWLHAEEQLRGAEQLTRTATAS